MSALVNDVGLVAREVVTSVAGLDFLQGLRDQTLPAPPLEVETGIWIVEADRGGVVFEAAPSKRSHNPLGTVHGGPDFDAARLGHRLRRAPALKAGQAYTTVDMTVDFVCPVFEKTGKLRCEGKIIHAGRRIATAEGRVCDEASTLIAHGSETCMATTVPARHPD